MPDESAACIDWLWTAEGLQWVFAPGLSTSYTDYAGFLARGKRRTGSVQNVGAGLCARLQRVLLSPFLSQCRHHITLCVAGPLHGSVCASNCDWPSHCTVTLLLLGAGRERGRDFPSQAKARASPPVFLSLSAPSHAQSQASKSSCISGTRCG